MGVTLKVLDPTPNCPASVVAKQTVCDRGVLSACTCAACLTCMICSNAAVPAVLPGSGAAQQGTLLLHRCTAPGNMQPLSLPPVAACRSVAARLPALKTHLPYRWAPSGTPRRSGSLPRAATC